MWIKIWTCEPGTKRRFLERSSVRESRRVSRDATARGGAGQTRAGRAMPRTVCRPPTERHALTARGSDGRTRSRVASARGISRRLFLVVPPLGTKRRRCSGSPARLHSPYWPPRVAALPGSAPSLPCNRLDAPPCMAVGRLNHVSPGPAVRFAHGASFCRCRHQPAPPAPTRALTSNACSGIIRSTNERLMATEAGNDG